MKNEYLRDSIIDPIVGLLRQGITPEKIALSLAWGITLGSLPVLGVTTVLCVAVALLFRLNLVVIQLANWIAYPLQIILFVPFILAGTYLFGAVPLAPDPSSLITLFRSDFTQSLRLLGDATLRASFAWALTAPFMITAIYGSTKPILKRFLKNHDVM